MKILIVGMGEIGKAIYDIIYPVYKEVYTRDLDFQKSFKVDVLHITYPYSDDFERVTNNYITLYKPDYTLVHSTVPVGTCSKLNGLVAHCPVRGRHKDLVLGLKTYEMLVGFNNPEAYNFIEKYLNRAGVKTKPAYSTDSTEIVKLLSLVQYAFNIEFARYAKECTDKYSVNYDHVKDYTNTYNEGVKRLEGTQFYKSNLNPPEGKIGGHCVLQAVSTLSTKVPNEVLDYIIKVNKEL